MFSSSPSLSAQIADFRRKAQYDEDDNLLDHEEIIKEIYEKLQHNKNITHILLDENFLTYEQIALLAQCLKDHNNLRVLSLVNNGAPIDVFCIPFLKRIINEHPTLEKLILDHSLKLDEELIALVTNNTYEFNQRLKTMEISIKGNGFTTHGLRIAEKFLNPKSAETIISTNLSRNNPHFVFPSYLNEKPQVFSAQAKTLLVRSERSAFTPYRATHDEENVKYSNKDPSSKYKFG